ncbi:hypothetical protein Pssp01_23120 [Pseudomonas sp. NBRC 100443]|nr:hypothetical protein Pssp01_23120 [Pseudomonas sp. NBRC 100443]
MNTQVTPSLWAQADAAWRSASAPGRRALMRVRLFIGAAASRELCNHRAAGRATEQGRNEPGAYGGTQL